MTAPRRVALIPNFTPDVPQELAEQATALVRAVQAHPSLSVTIVFHEPEPTTPKVPVFVGGDLHAALHATLALSAGLCDMVGVEVTSITVNNEPGMPIAVRLGEVRHDQD